MRSRRPSGLTLIEILVAFAILVVLVSPIIDLMIQSFRGNEASINELVFTNLANELVDSLVHADRPFLTQAVTLAAGNWKDLSGLGEPERRKFLRSDLPSNLREIAFKLDEDSGPGANPPGYSLRVRVKWDDRAGERTLALARFFAPEEGP
jgi:hypothetical protein